MILTLITNLPSSYRFIRLPKDSVLKKWPVQNSFRVADFVTGTTKNGVFQF